MSGKESTEYNGPETNEVYSDENTFETFEDLDEMESDPEETEQQGTSSHDGESFEEGEEADEERAQEKAARKAKAEKAAKNKARGQKGDDLDKLDTIEEEESEEEESEEEEEYEEEEEEGTEQKPEDKKQPKGKPTYVTVDGETYAVDSNALISTQVDGKTEKVTLQELKNNYAGKVVYEKKFNEINLKEHSLRKEAAITKQKLDKIEGVKKQIMDVIADPDKDPEDAFKLFLDSLGVDSYDLLERSFKTKLSELANVLNMEPADRKNYFLEKKNSHLLEQTKKRNEAYESEQRVTSYRSKVDALRKSYGVSEAQYVDAYEELKSFEGVDEKDLNEKDIVEWAATKPHRETVRGLLDPYKDQLQGDSYGELSWKLANILRAGTETTEQIKKNLAAVYGAPTDVKKLSSKLKALGRKTDKAPPKSTSKNGKFESFDDIDDD